MEQLFKVFGSLNEYSIVLRLVLAMIAGSLVGIDRSRSGSPAGLKTHSLVCIGACLIMITSEFIVSQMGGDSQRMPAQVISGVGFLGAGTILVRQDRVVKGLTSAAGIWFSACIGLTIGIGFYLAAAVSLLCVFFTTHVLSKTRIQIPDSYLELYISYTDEFLVQDLVEIVHHLNGRVLLEDIDKFSILNTPNRLSGLVFRIELHSYADKSKVLRAIRCIKGALSITEV